MAYDSSLVFASRDPGRWVDIDGFWRGLGLPNVVLKADQLAMHIDAVEDWMFTKRRRRMLYKHVSGSTITWYKIELELLKIVAPITIMAASTSTIYGLLIGEDAALTAATDEQQTIAGVCFPYYYNRNTVSEEENSCVLALAAGDAIWVVRKGHVVLKNTGGSTDEDILVPAASGTAASATALVGAGPQTAAIFKHHSREYQALGRWKATVLTGNYALAWLDMPDRHVDP